MEQEIQNESEVKFWFRQKSDDGLEAKLGYTFKDPELLAHALMHRSCFDGRDVPYAANNERLEFLGDSVLNMLTTEFLYKKYPEDPEGELSKRKSAIVSGHACAQSSDAWDLGVYVKMGKSEVKMGGRHKESILADAYEAVLGAVYLDGGLEEVRTILNKFHFPRAEEIISADDFVNFKSALLEWTQGKLRQVPEYKLVAEDGPEHMKVFTVEVSVGERTFSTGQGMSKKKAEQDAARLALEILKAEEEVALKEAAELAAKAEAEGITAETEEPEKPTKKKLQPPRYLGRP